MPEEQKTEKERERADDRSVRTPIRILVVDDEPSILQFFQVLFGRLDYMVTVAEDDIFALRLVETETFDLAFVDCFLDKVNGAEVARKLRQVQPELKIVLMSGYVVDDQAAAMELAGANVFLVKPFSGEHARAIVDRLFHCSPSQRIGVGA